LTQKVFLEDMKVFLEDAKVFFEDRRKHLKFPLQYCRMAIKVFSEDRLPLLPISTYKYLPCGGLLLYFFSFPTEYKEGKAFTFYNGGLHARIVYNGL